MANKVNVIRRTWVLPVAWILFVAVTFGQNPGAATSRESLKIRLLKGDSAKVGAPIVVSVTFTNLSNDDLDIMKEIHGHELRVDVRDSNGKSASETKFGHAWNYFTGIGVSQREPPPSDIPSDVLNGNAVFGKLKTGDWTEWQINVARLYDLTVPGKYAIQIEMRDPQNVALRSIVKSNEIIIAVTP